MAHSPEHSAGHTRYNTRFHGPTDYRRYRQQKGKQTSGKQPSNLKIEKIGITT